MSNTRLQFALTEEQEQVRELAHEIAQREFAPNALRWEKSNEFPSDNMRVLAETGLLGATVPEEYGGAGGSWLDAALILEQLGRSCYVTAMAALGELGVQTQAIVQFGSDEQKQRYLPRIAAGELFASICITEPETGSDIASITTNAHTDGDTVMINGAKCLISRADVAGLFLVYVRFDDRDGAAAIGSILVERDTPGLQIGVGRQTLGGESLFDVNFDNCAVPVENILVKEDGFRRMLSAFNGQRCLNGSISVGIAQGAQDAAVEYATQRTQGGQAISDYQGIQWVLAENEIQLEAARLLIWRAAAAAGGFPTRYQAAIAKTYANEMALRVTDAAMQIFGGHGYLKEMPAERFLRWARYGPLGGGTPHIQRNGIAREILRRSRRAAS